MEQEARRESTSLRKLDGADTGIIFATNDALDHTLFARQVADDLKHLRRASVIGIQGSWGRGKTDAVARLFTTISTEEAFAPPIWINPWQYGTPDLIRPVVLEILRRISPDKRSANERIRRAAKTLLRAGNAMLFKAVSVVAPFGEIIGAGEKHVDELLSELFNDDKSVIDPDPVYAMAERFRDLAEEYLVAADVTGPLVICIDDLDRCLPDHQIAMLEAIYFLTGAGANCSFVIALDPTLVQHAAFAHYKTNNFDSEQYLNKLFDVRLNLPPISQPQIAGLIAGERPEMKSGSAVSEELDAALIEITQLIRVDRSQIGAAFATAMWLPELRNPRLIRRVLERLSMLARRENSLHAAFPEGTRSLHATVRWCALSERWPEARRVFQSLSGDDAESTRANRWRHNAEAICFSYGLYSRESFLNTEAELDAAVRRAQNMLQRLPNPQKAPDLGAYLVETFLSSDDSADLLSEIDTAMVKAGL